jgi:hypothetical protein
MVSLGSNKALFGMAKNKVIRDQVDLRPPRGVVAYVAGFLWLYTQGFPHLLLCYAWQKLWHEAGTYLAHRRPRKAA